MELLGAVAAAVLSLLGVLLVRTRKRKTDPEVAAPAPVVARPTAIDQKAEQLSRAIARAEGFGIAGALPTRAHNPGDLVLGDLGYGVIGRERVTIFPSDAEGWAALKRQALAMLEGKSRHYQPGMTIAQIARIYTGGDHAQSWAAAVSQDLGISPDTRLVDWFAV